MRKLLRNCVPFSCAVFMAVAPAPATVATAAVKNWVGGSGNWSNGSNWNGGTAPAVFDTVNIAPTDGVNRMITYDISAPNLDALFIDLTGAGINRTTFSMAGNNLTATGFLLGQSGRATWNHSGGSVVTNNALLDSVLGQLAGSSGIYNLSGTGSLSIARDLYVGVSGSGTFNQTGGINTIASSLNIGTNGTYNLNGGTLRFNTVGGGGGLSRLFYTAGKIQLAGDRVIGSDATIGTLFGTIIPVGKTLAIEGLAKVSTNIDVDGGSLTSPLQVRVGDPGSASIAITNGGIVASPVCLIGTFANGLVDVSDTGSMLSTESLNIGLGGTPGVLNVSSGGTVYVETQFLNASAGTTHLLGGTIRLDDDVVYENSGVFDFQAGTIQLDGDHILATDALVGEFFGVGPTIAAGKGLTIGGLATISTTTPVTMSGGTLNAETVLMIPGSRIITTQSSVVTGAILASEGSVIDAAAGNLVIGDATKVNGFYSNGTLRVGERTVTLADANDAVFDSAALVTLGSGASAGSLNAANGLTLDFGGNITGFGTVVTPNVIAKPLINNGHIAGNSAAQRITLPGYVKGVGTFDNVNVTGTFSPGLSPTILSVGNLTFSPSSTLIMELGGATPGGGYDQIQSSGLLALGGTLQVDLINGFSPSAGQSFNLFDWASVSGTFSTLTLPALTGLSWNTSQLYTTGVLSISAAPGLPGDFNNDGAVDAADYAVWRNGLGTTYTQADYNTWRANFGNTAGSGAGRTGLSNASVPEPSTCWLAIWSVALMTAARRIVLCRSARTRQIELPVSSPR